MNQPIKSGDLVRVAKMPHKCGEHLLGHFYRVEALMPAMWMYCTSCGERGVVYDSAARVDGCFQFPLSWLRRIPPLSELESVEQREEIVA